MATRTDILKRFIDMTATTGVADNAAWDIGVGPYTVGSIQVTNLDDTAWGSGVLTITASNDGVTYYSLPAWVGTPSTISASGLYGPYDLTGIAFLRVKTTASEATLAVNATFVGKGDS